MNRLVLAILPILAACSTPNGPDQRADVIKHMFSSTAQIIVERDGKSRNTGSGVVLKVDGKAGRTLLLTAKHVVEPLGNERVYVVGPRRRSWLDAKVLAVSSEFDLALVETTGLPAAEARLKGDATLGDDIWVVAFPWGQRRTLVTGIVSQIDRNDDDQNMAKGEIPISGPVTLIDAAASFGTSGGGVFDIDSGQLLGIVRGYRTVTFSLPGNQSEPIKFPVGGETTVVPTAHIAAFLREAKLDALVPEGMMRVTAASPAR